MKIPGSDVEAELLIMPPKIAAVYFLLHRGSVVYVGKTKNLIARKWTHEHGKEFDEVLFIRCKEGDLTEVEDEWLLKLRPPLNGPNAFVEAERRMKLRREVLHID